MVEFGNNHFDNRKYSIRKHTLTNPTKQKLYICTLENEGYD